MKRSIVITGVLALCILAVLVFITDKSKEAVICEKGTNSRQLKYFESTDTRIIEMPYLEEKTISVKKPSFDAVSSATIEKEDDFPTVYSDRMKPEYLRIHRPYDRASFPPNIAPPLFQWDDPENNLWLVIFTPDSGAKVRIITKELSWRPSCGLWSRMKEKSLGGSIGMKVLGCSIDEEGKIKENTVHRSHEISFRISEYPADDVIIYRMVKPMFSAAKTPDIYLRHISSFKKKPFLPSGGKYCTCCHTFSSKSKSSKISVQWRNMVEGGAGFTVYDRSTGKGKKIGISLGGSTFMCWSPDATKLAMTVRQKLVTLFPITQETQYAYSPTADIAVYDAKKNSISLLPGASSADLLENYPRWSTDGKTIAFCMDRNETAEEGRFKQKYNIHLIPYNDGNGGKPVPLKGASFNGKSNYYPRYSPDGKWLSFCRSNYGSLIKPSSDIYLYSLEDGAVKRLECNSDNAADSWHSWSSNSRWLVFTSKRDDGTFARLYFTEIDEQGKSSPPVILPDREFIAKSYNVPEFQKEDPGISSSKLYRILNSKTVKQAREIKVE